MYPFNTITTEELMKKLEAGEELNMVDIREDHEVIHGMIPGAKHIRMNEIPENLDLFDKNQEYIIICRSSGRSKMVCNFMHEQGYKVTDMEGGMLEWEGELIF